MLKFIFPLVILINNLMSCSNPKNNKFSSVVWDYPGDMYFLSKKNMRYCDSNAVKKKLHLTIRHKLDRDLSNLDMRVSINGTVYLGKYKNSINIKNFCPSGEVNESFSVQLIDRENNIAYVWAEKDVHDLSKVNNVNLILLPNESKGSNLKVIY